MMEDEIRVLSPTALLGYRYPPESLATGMLRQPHVTAVDAGLTEGDPYYLGIEPGASGSGGQVSAFMAIISRDLAPLLAAVGAKIPLIIGSDGFAGTERHQMGTLAVARRAADEKGLGFKVAAIHAEKEKEYVKEKLRAGKVTPLCPVPKLTEDEIDRNVRIVAQRGWLPFDR